MVSTPWMAIVPFALGAGFAWLLVRYGTPRWLGDGNVAALLLFFVSAFGGLFAVMKLCPPSY
jgi:hypothetical protein